MNEKHTSTGFPTWATVLLCAVFAVLGMVHLTGSYKVLTLLIGLGMIALLCFADLKPLKNVSTLLLLAYVVFSGFTIFWAMSGKFFLREYSKIFAATAVFLFVVLVRRSSLRFRRHVMTVIAGISSLYAIANVEAATTGLIRALLSGLPSMAGVDFGFESGTRLTGIFGNANSMATVLAFGILFSIALLCSAEGKGERSLFAGMLSINAYAFLLAFSMGALACFVLAVLVYLISAGSGRMAALLRMLEAAVPTLLCAFAAFPFFNREGAALYLPLLFLILDLVLVILLEQKVIPRALTALAGKQKAALLMVIVVILLAAGYIVAGYHLTGAYSFGETLERSAYPDPGQHTLSVDAAGDVNVTILSQDRSQTMMHTNTELYSGSASDASFTVPEGSMVCFFTFEAEPGTVLRSASVDGTESIPLKYTLLPGFAANRLQGLWANENAIQRGVFMEDGWKLFRLSPVIGNGVGAFETGVSSVQSFYYETKYVHNHYIQTMLESGVVGLVCFAGTILTLAAALWKKHRAEMDPEFSFAYPAFWAALVMAAAHAAIEVSLSIVVDLCFVYALFGLIVRDCGTIPGRKPVEEAPPAPPVEPPTAKGKKKKQLQKKVPEKPVEKKRNPLPHIAAILLPALFLLTLCGNLWAISIESKSASSETEFFENLELAAKVDLYEKNDAKLSYVMAQLSTENPGAHLDRANEYAAELSQVQSNSIPQYLVSFYLGTQQYERAIDAAIQGASYSASNPKVWNAGASLLGEALLAPEASPLLTGDKALLGKLSDYCEMLTQHNAEAMEPIALEDTAAQFFETAERITDCDGSPEAIAAILNP